MNIPVAENPDRESNPTPGTPEELLREGARLLAEGSILPAVEMLTSAAELRPDHAPSLNALGVALRAAERTSEAVVAFGRAAAIDPGHAPAFANLAKTLYATNRFVDASAAAEQALELRPDDAGTMAILGGSLLAVGRASRAVPLLTRAVELTGGRAAIRCLLARALDVQGDFQGALEQSRLALEAEPENPECVVIAGRLALRENELKQMDKDVLALAKAHPEDRSADFLHRAFTGAGGVERAPEDYVVQLFDRYADRFDEHLVTGLRYAAHRLVGEASARILDGRMVGNILDAGCGTGLTSEYLRPLTRRLEGVDLSGKMLEIAGKLGRYDALHQDDLERFLEAGDAPFDLVAAADVFVYFGDLGPVFKSIRRRLAPGAPFIFTLEWQDIPGWRLTEHGRFVHSPEHVAASGGGLFHFRELSNVVLRAERGEPVLGLLCILEAAS